MRTNKNNLIWMVLVSLFPKRLISNNKLKSGLIKELNKINNDLALKLEKHYLNMVLKEK